MEVVFFVVYLLEVWRPSYGYVYERCTSEDDVGLHLPSYLHASDAIVHLLLPFLFIANP
jgi:hypothetical protein